MAHPAYEPVLSAKAANFLLSLSKKRQRSLIQLIRQLALHPAQIGNYSICDATGRQVQFILLKDFVIAYWPDDAVCEFRIVDIEEA